MRLTLVIVGDYVGFVNELVKECRITPLTPGPDIVVPAMFGTSKASECLTDVENSYEGINLGLLDHRRTSSTCILIHSYCLFV